MVMVGFNLLKGGATIPIPILLRNYGGVRPLLPACCCQFRPLSCCSYGFAKSKMIMARPGPTKNLFFCSTAFQKNVTAADSSSSNPEAPSSSPSDDNDGEDDPETKIRNAANTLDIRVGRILRAWRHEEADSLYVEEVDIGEPQPRIICSGLVNYISLNHLQDKQIVVLANLKPRNMRGVKSSGMLMAASDASHENVELLLPPEGSLPGERIWFGTPDEKDNLPAVAPPNQIQKKKIWELVQPHLKTDSNCVASLGEHYMRTAGGLVVCTSLRNANIS